MHLYELLPHFRASEFDYVIFDMPPMGQTSPTLAMAGLMDKVLLVVDGEDTSRDALKWGYSELVKGRADVSCVFNKARSHAPRWVAGEIPAIGRVTAKVVERLSPILRKSIQSAIVEHVARSFNAPTSSEAEMSTPPTASSQAASPPPLDAGSKVIESRDGVTTTADELRWFEQALEWIREISPLAPGGHPERGRSARQRSDRSLARPATMAADCGLPVVDFGQVSVVRAAQERDVGRRAVTAVTVRMPVMELQPAARLAAASAGVHEGAASAGTLIDGAPHRRQDEARPDRRVCLGQGFPRSLLPNRRASIRSSFSVTACSTSVARSASGTSA